MDNRRDYDENQDSGVDFLENLNSFEENDKENIVSRVGMLAQSTLEDLREQKNELESKLKEAFEERLKLEQEVSARRNKTIALKEQTEQVEAECAEKSKKLTILKNEYAELKKEKSSLPMLAYEKQYKYLVSQLESLDNVSAKFSKLKNKENIENAGDALVTEIEKLKKKNAEDIEIMEKLKSQIEKRNNQIRSYPIKTMEAVGAALQRDLEDAESAVQMQHK